jgi:hypothetical protein
MRARAAMTAPQPRTDLVRCALALLAGSVALGGCGFSGIPRTTDGDQVSFILHGVPAEDGVVLSDHTVRTDGTLPQVGDLGGSNPTLVGRQVFSFDLTPIPAGSIIVSAQLRADQYVVFGTPYATLGTVLVDHLEYGLLDETDFAARALQEGLGPFSKDASLGAKTVDVSAAVAQDLAVGRTRTQYRLRFSPTETDGNTQNDFASFAEADAAVTGQGQAPVVAVTARLPR